MKPPKRRRFAILADRTLVSSAEGRRTMRLGKTAIVVIAIWSFAACHMAPGGRAPRAVRLATGSADGFSHAFGEALVSAYNREIPGIAASEELIGGSVNKVNALDKGAIDLAVVVANIAYTAYAEGMLRGAPSYGRLRGIAVVYSSALHVVVRADSRFHELADLRDTQMGFAGTVANYFPTSSDDEPTVVASDLISGNVQLTRFTLDDLPQAFESRQVTGAFVLAGYPLEVLKESARKVPLRLLEIGPDVAARIRAQHPFLKPWVIPANTYVGQHEPIRTVAVEYLLVCRDDLDEELVYVLTKGLFESFPRSSKDQKMGWHVNADWASATPVPLHPGAARYYRERELLR